MRALLAPADATEIACTVETRVDLPNEVFDTYGRLIGDIYVDREGSRVDANQLLVGEGLAFPAFYVSMRPEEIQTLLDLASAAKKAKKGFWKHYTQDPGKFNFDLVYRPGKAAKPQDDSGPALFPKFFRRQTTWACYKKAKVTKKDFQYFLLDQKDDGFYKTSSFLKNPDQPSGKLTKIGDSYKGGKFTVAPDQMVFTEKPSTLVGADGKSIHSWFATGAGT
jgi:hypothetical protein